MRFCPFCAQETSDEAGRCVHCGRRLSARTTQHAPVPLPAGPGDAEVLDGGPTRVSDGLGPADPTGLSPASALPVAVQPADMEEDTRLPPPAPGLVPPQEPLSNPGYDPPTRRAILMRPLGALPAQRLPSDEETSPRPLPPTDRTSPMVRMDPSGPTAGPTAGPAEALAALDLPKASQNIPALPPPPVAPLDPISIPPARALSVPSSEGTPSGFLLSSSRGAPRHSETPPTSQIRGPAAAPAGTLSGSLSLSAISSVSAIPGVTAGRLSPRLAPIPAAPASNSVGDTLRYLYVVVRGVLNRRTEQRLVRQALVAQQRSLDGLLLQLGKAAFAQRLSAPALDEEMGHLHRAEERRLLALTREQQLGAQRELETQRSGAIEAQLKEALARLSKDAEQLDSELRQRANQRRALLAEVARMDGLLLRLRRTAEDADARAQGRAGQGQPEQQVASQARAQADSARGQAEALAPQREQAVREAGALDGPIAELTQRLGQTRSDLGLTQAELLRQQADHQSRLQALQADLALCIADRQSAERELQQRMMTVGTLVNLTRPGGDAFAELYLQVDDLKARLTDYEATLARLATEMDLYDQQAVQRGLLYLGGLVLCVGALAALLYIAWGLLHMRPR